MSNWVIVGIIALVTVICCIVTAKFTGNEKKVTVGGIFAVLSAGGFGYAIAYLVRKGLTGPYLTVAVLVGIVVPILIFLTIYNLVKETSPKGNRAERTIDEKIRTVEEDKHNIKKASKEIEASKKELALEKGLFEKDKASLDALKVKLLKEKERLKEDKALLTEGKVSAADLQDQYDIGEEKAIMLEGFEREKQLMKQDFQSEREQLMLNFDEERTGIRKSVEEEKHKLQQAFLQEKEKFSKAEKSVEDPSQTAALKEQAERVKLLEQKAAEFGLEREEWSEKLHNLDLQCSSVQIEKERLYSERQRMQKELESEQEKSKEVLMKVQSLEQQLHQKAQEEKLRQQADEINMKSANSLDCENVIEKGKALQNRGLYQLAITLYEECIEKVPDDNQKQLIIKEMANCFMDAGEPGKAKKLLAKR